MTQSCVCVCVLPCGTKGLQKESTQGLGDGTVARCQLAPVISESPPDGFIRAQFTRTHTHAEYPLRVSWCAKSAGALPDRHPELCVHTHTHTLDILCTRTDWQRSKTCTIPVIYPACTHTHTHSTFPLLSGQA